MASSLTITMTTEPVLDGYYIAPTGNDTTGDGSIGSPWRSVNKFATVAVAGDTLYCRGGTYTGTTRTTVTSRSGSSGSPITVCNYPGEAPVFAGPGTGSAEQFIHFYDGVSYWVIDGLTTQAFKPGASGVVYVGDATVSTHHIIIRNCHFTATSGGTTSEQQVYLSAYADDCTVESNVFVGAQVAGDGGTGVNVGDEDPGPQRFLVQRNIFTHFGDTGAIWVNSPQITGSILHNTFDDSAGTSVTFIRTPDYADIVIRDNAGTSATNHIMEEIYDQDVGGTKTIDHNFWAQTFDASHYLADAQTGINAASDGSDAGALDRGD